MNSLLKTRILSALSAPLLLMGAAATAGAPCDSTNNPPTVPDPPLSLAANAGDPQILIPTADLATDVDLDLLKFTLETGVITGDAGGILVPDPEGLRYTPPPELDVDMDEVFNYTVSDNHWGEATGALNITVSATPAPLPCDRLTGGPACFGQTWDGRWFTLDEEKLDQVRSTDGKTRLALFVPSKAEYLTPDKAKGKIIAIFPNPGGGYESFWGCGPAQAVVGPSRFTCDFGQSLRGDVTYMYRLPVINGKIYRTTVQTSGSGMSDQYGSWFVALSKTPNTTIAFDGTTPSGEPAGCMGWGSAKTINPYTCSYLVSRTSPPAPALEMLYFKMQAAPARTYVAGQWTGTRSSECAKSLRCRMYLSSW